MGSLQGYIKTTYKNLIKTLGEPTMFDGDKTNVEWWFKLPNGNEVDIYDYKQPRITHGMFEWHVGGESKQDVIDANKIIKGTII